MFSRKNAKTNNVATAIQAFPSAGVHAECPFTLQRQKKEDIVFNEIHDNGTALVVEITRDCPSQP
jgi:hypothetical protein